MYSFYNHAHNYYQPDSPLPIQTANPSKTICVFDLLSG